MFNELLGLPLFPWTATSAYAFADANERNLRYLNHFYDADRAQSVPRARGDPPAPPGHPVGEHARGRLRRAAPSTPTPRWCPHVTDAKAAELQHGARGRRVPPAAPAGARRLALGVRLGQRPGRRPARASSGRATCRSSTAPTTSRTRTTPTGSATPSSRSRASRGSSATSARERSLRTRLGLRMIREQGRVRRSPTCRS